MLIVLLVTITGSTAVRNSIVNQYYQQLAQVAGEAGVAYAEACLNTNGGVPLWSDAAPLKPNTDCSGVELVACPTTSTNALCSVTLNGNIRSSFSIGLPPIEKPSALVVAGGGSGGGSTGGGGGGGGVVYAPGTSLTIGPYSIVVGAGGLVSGNQATGKNGQDSTFNGITATGGGGGGYSAGGTSGGPGLTGGSGGGGQNYYGLYASGRGIPGQGNDGGSFGTTAGSGGGGAGGAGGAGTGANNGGVGGAGIANTITGASVLYGGGGGGGGATSSAAGGSGGGGAGANSTVGTAGTANRGGGGGGGWGYAGGNGGVGGSGVVIVRYPTGSITASGGNSTTTSGNYTIKTFTGSGTLTVSAVSNAITTIPNTGFVEELRNSNSAVWRRYDQKQAPASVVPDLCSGNAKAIYGWNNAVVVPSIYSIPGQSISAIQGAVGALNPGPNYYRKDFSITSSGTYTLAGNGGAVFDAYIDGRLLLYQAGGSASTKTIDLTAGCHTIYVRAVNGIILPNSFELLMSLTKSGTTIPVVQTDSSWRVSSGAAVHYSDYRYSQSSGWSAVRNIEASTATSASWSGTSGSSSTRTVSTTHSASGLNYPASQYTYFRDSGPIVTTSPTDVKITYMCDDSCNIYLDGQQISSTNSWSNIYTYNTTLSEGYHWLAASLFNGGTAAGGSKILIAMVNSSTNSVVTETNASWYAANFWDPTFYESYSFDSTFVSNPPSYDCTCTSPGTTNIAPNPTLATSIGSWNTSYAGGSTGTDSRVTSGGPSGIASAFFRRTLNATWSGGVSMSMDGLGVLATPVIPGQKYTVSGYLRSNVATTGIRANVIESDIAGNQINNQLGSSISSTANTWQRASSTFTLDSKTVYVQVRLQFLGVTSAPSGSTFDVTGMMMTAGDTLFNYADGGSSGWSWLGASNVSPSSGPAL